jgi:hypothetical protein
MKNYDRVQFSLTKILVSCTSATEVFTIQFSAEHLTTSRISFKLLSYVFAFIFVKVYSLLKAKAVPLHVMKALRGEEV